MTPPEPTVDGFVQEFLQNLNLERGVTLSASTVNDRYVALATTVRDYLVARWLEDRRAQRETRAKTVCYLSAEYLLGRQLDNNLLAADLTGIATEAMAACGVDIDELRAVEVEPGLGNGGLGRLAACFIDSLATMGVPNVGYGIRYEYGIFRQTFVDGQQVEQPDAWLALGSPWEFPHPEAAQTVSFGGHTETYDDGGQTRTRWIPDWSVRAVPYNYMVPGYRNGRVNTLRLWSAQATDAFDLRIFNAGDYEEAVRAQTYAENISKVLYPEDSTPQGKQLRLQQQYFFVAASIADVMHDMGDADLRTLPDRVAFQLNDTHPVIAVPELMRVLVDERGMHWDAAWEIARQCFGYTCHTLMPEALETWPVDLLGRLLPRHLEIIFRINADFLAEVREAYPNDEMRVRDMSIIAEFPERSVRMAYLATVAASKVNGVAELHSQLLRETVLHDFDEFFPGKFTNVTNGVTPRRFLRLANPELSALITAAIGDGWETDLERLRELEPYADDPAFRDAFADVKARNKRRLDEVLRARDGLEVREGHLLDVMVKRLHEYKRQTLKLLHVVTLYEGIVSGRLAASDVQPRTVIFGAKAAPGYGMAKRIIHLINAVGSVVNTDPRVEGRLQVLFPPNYNVTLAERVIPAADLSEQISLAGKEASGTGNMKFALNGALTIGTDDGANIEIRELVGDENFFLFGMREPEVEALAVAGYRPSEFYQADDDLRRAIDLIASGAFSGGDASVFEPIVSNLLYDDRFMVLADYRSYLDAQARVDAAYADRDAWTRSAILNVARTGYFSSDRSMREYLDRIWHASPVA
ncbi:glycogen/starch/alpha-glucan phosphorylase [Microbacterium sp. zg.Y1090]|nr:MULTISPECIES: glycogen/starch/alpha-glucan phosphorylase [unclassified Microbacterium]MCR2814132.1 glycogen/starch/alpha-glucan phosphorylase [Microbacterium sp. zg.Y1084]MCR2819888.1 glycogen/starch/alpha-glucan phosphorylase [Microbacterium sp. zg.Y1090]MDL5487999.1 glycogen/starch/alpha-glucan phosphorylase [Microbacterium sp. zg-Y1211]WIM29751.1 glycogen/starch/alpha-glucan phosphorylase [Microbacterium sp. zg-Y1090]